MMPAWILNLASAVTKYVIESPLPLVILYQSFVKEMVHILLALYLCDVSNPWQIFQDDTVEMMMKSEDLTGSSSRPPRKDETQRYSGSKEAISTKYAAMREQNKPVESIASAKVSLLDAGNPQPTNTTVPAGLASKWASMKQGFQNFKTNIEAKKFIPLRQSQEPKLLARASSAESLDEIFQRLKRPAEDQGRSGDGDEDEDELETSSR